MKTDLLPAIDRAIQRITKEDIGPERRALLMPFVRYVAGKIQSGESIQLNFICTHNSRRSHLAQVWAQAMAQRHGVGKVACYSGGTEVTSMAPLVIEALATDGFEVVDLNGGANPVRAIRYGAALPPLVAFSKAYDHPFNPSTGFAALMTCAEADSGCPYIAGAEARFPLNYQDPKSYDGTPQALAKYLERSRQIAAEMHFVFGESRRKQDA